MKKERAMAIVLMAVGASLFGFLGLCTRYFMGDRGIGPLDTVAIRLFVASLFLLLILALASRSSLKIHRKDIPVFIVFGIFKFMSDVTYFYAQDNITLCLATLLQMTAPYYVMVVSLFLFREKITMKMLVAMVMSSIGCVLVTGVLFGSMDARVEGIFSALLSGLFFGMFIIGGRVMHLRGIRPETGLFYVLLVADIIAIPFIDIGGIGEAVSDFEGITAALAIGVMMTLIPFYIYTWCSSYLEPTLASMISILELVVAAVVGFVFFSEALSPVNILGITIVIASVMLINLRIRKGYRKRFGEYVPPGLSADKTLAGNC